ncbi:MAG: peptidyl-alpha-hydroxyglycine alpha-amidating lyase family protein [Planctomycetaceae bacterium]
MTHLVPKNFGSLVLLMTLLLAKQSVAAEPPVPVPGFLKIPASVTLGAASGVDVDSKGRVYLFHRGKQPILCFDSQGRFLRSWGDDLIGKAHGLRIDRQDNIWVTDIGHHLVLKYSPAGKLLLALGQTDKPGTGSGQFNQPTDVAFAANGDLYVSDGYGNNRIMKFNARGKFLARWGKAGTDRGEFNLPHTIVVDRKGRVIVGDRENNRVQVFDANGQWLATWPGVAPFGLALDTQGSLFVADGRANQVVRLDPSTGKILARWGGPGTKPGQFQLPHMLAVDRQGSLYVVEILGERLQKLTRSR